MPVRTRLPLPGLMPADRQSVTPAQRPIRHVDASAIVEVLGAGVLTIDSEGLVTSSNPQAAKILRRSRHEIDGKPIVELIASMDELVEAFRSARRERGARARDQERGEVTTRLPDGSTIALGFSLSVLNDASAGTHHVVLFQEITPLLELRKERDRLLQMAAIGEIMPTLLHEIRNPLAAVTAMLEVLVEDADARMQGDLHAILCEVRRMALGLQGIGGLVRTLDSSSYSALDLAVREACRLLDETARRRGVTLHAIGPDLPLLALDRGAVCGVVFNLVKNAIDACGEGGEVTVDARIENGGADFVLAVADNGVGMSPEVAARCRELFFTTKDSGSGVGLALCNEVIGASNGTLTIDSTPGRGTTVTVRVPIPTEPHHTAPDSRRARRI